MDAFQGDAVLQDERDGKMRACELSKQLLKCPFCGGDASYRISDYTYSDTTRREQTVCIDCGIGYSAYLSTWQRDYDERQQALVNKWNRRDGKHGKMVIERGGTVAHCSICGWAYDYDTVSDEKWNYCPNCGATLSEVEE